MQLLVKTLRPSLLILLLSACSQFPFVSNESSTENSANDNPLQDHEVNSRSNLNHVTQSRSSTDQKPAHDASTSQSPLLETIHFPVIDDTIAEFSPQALILPHAPNGWIVDYAHEPLPVLSGEHAVNESGDVFERMRKGFTFDLQSTNKRTEAQLNWYVRNPEYLERVFTRSSRYLYHIVERLEQENLPQELALLPLVESAFNPFAYSHGRASGLWQFIPGTGKMYGLHQSWWYDGRRDVLASTEAAINYLSWLNRKFDGDWLHALASYNSGSGRVSKAIRKNKKQGKPTDFWSLRLPRETRAYVPKLIAIAKIVAEPEKYGIEIKPIADTPYFKTVHIESQLDLAQAALLAEIDIEELYQLNPGLNQWATPPTGPHRLLVPVNKAEVFAENLASLPKNERLTWDNYKVKTGDSLGKIAAKFHTTPDLISQVNRLKRNKIYSGQSLLIPVASKQKQFYNLSEQNRIATKQSKVKGKAGTTRVFYTVKTGDTFWDISRAHKVGVRDIAKWNGMAPGDVLRPGKKLLIWSKTAGEQVQAANVAQVVNVPSLSRSYAPRDSLKRINYKVRRGDSLWLIANRFNVSIKELKQWNKINKKHIQPGQRLTVFVDITQG
jgi:peptidoglycan lytic transglycosylase D